MKKTCYQCENYNWTKQKMKNRTTVIRSRRQEKKSVVDYIRSLLF